jgi:hypothetical protein
MMGVSATLDEMGFDEANQFPRNLPSHSIGHAGEVLLE